MCIYTTQTSWHGQLSLNLVMFRLFPMQLMIVLYIVSTIKSGRTAKTGPCMVDSQSNALIHLTTSALTPSHVKVSNLILYYPIM